MIDATRIQWAVSYAAAHGIDLACEAREYLSGYGFRDMSVEDIEDLSDHDALRGAASHFDGGLRAFAAYIVQTLESIWRGHRANDGAPVHVLPSLD